MILKGSQRANGSDLAIHLMNGFDNERIEIAELRGSVADDLYGAFAEFEAVAAGTKADKYLYSLSINPPEPLTRDQYLEAIATIEDRLGLGGQPRAVVFHVKPDENGIGREHCHVVWSRIDLEAMKAIHMSHDKRRLMDCAVELAHRFDLELPPGLKAWEEKRYDTREKLDPTLAEKAQQDRTGITPEERRAEITQAYEQADSAEAFRAALEEKGYVLARGDRRGFVIVDRQCDVHSLTRYIKGHKAKDIKAKLAGLDRDALPSVDEAKDLVRKRGQAMGEGKGENTGKAEEHQAELAQMRKALERRLADKQVRRQASINGREQELLTRQQSERMALHAAQLREGRGLIFRARRAVAGLIGKTPGLRSVLGPIQKLTHLDPAQRQAAERESLARRHEREKLDIARSRRMAQRLGIRERQALERRMKRAELKAESLEQQLRQDFFEAARDRRVKTSTDMPQGKLSEAFNDAGEFAEGLEQARAADLEDEQDKKRARTWKQRAKERRRGRGRGFQSGRRGGKSFRRDDD
ncbi:hypothetical protein DEA8626_01429 [Defluviimonas aquaemixtae]|uniref:MobA/VirD2-like nuclease domain-containing protein n=1 Tax=Albidovulum aquaemixtae TaxID=1542388 RepID=A0A2R8B5H1_9RHOB|nr:relaxase/mobilization nuclease domain-containing protein [Defluviimonas aquaemixtae]SPH17901.1 hypothetical protein DEA8626_01429 [Defluviimonas aquaemixtae]